MMCKNNLLVILLLLTLLSTKLMGQSASEASVSGQIGQSTNYYNGSHSINIPLYTVGNIPISLNYNTSGIQISQEAGWIGLGWALNAGGVIIQNIRGLNDLTHNTGDFLKDISGCSSDILNGSGCQDNIELCKIANCKDYKSDELSQKDWDYDLFTYNFNGIGGQFILTGDGEVMEITKSDLSIINYGGDAFIITTKEGIRYTFTRNSTTKEGQSNQVTSVTYSLTKVTSAGSPDELLISYTAESYKLPSYYETHGKYTEDGINFIDETSGIKRKESYITYNVSRIDQITYKNTLVKFIAGDREDLKNSQLLHQIQIRTNDEANKLIKTFDFEYDYSVATVGKNNYACADGIPDQWCYDTDLDRRLMLIKVIEKNDSQIKKPYLFTYHYPLKANSQTDIIIPKKCSFAQDHWGYYNGIDDNNYLMPLHVQWFTNPNYPTVQVILGIDGNGKSANRIADETGNLTKVFGLKTITYPQGYIVSYEYEPNEYVLSNTTTKGGGLRIKSISEQTFESGIALNHYNTRQFQYQGGVLFSSLIYGYGKVTNNLKDYDTYYEIKPEKTDKFGCALYETITRGYAKASSFPVRSVAYTAGSLTVGYSKTTEIIGELGESGQNEYEFINTPNAAEPLINEVSGPVISPNHYNGALSKLSVYKAGTKNSSGFYEMTKIKETTTIYNSDAGVSMYSINLSKNFDKTYDRNLLNTNAANENDRCYDNLGGDDDAEKYCNELKIPDFQCSQLSAYVYPIISKWVRIDQVSKNEYGISSNEFYVYNSTNIQLPAETYNVINVKKRIKKQVIYSSDFLTTGWDDGNNLIKKSTILTLQQKHINIPIETIISQQTRSSATSSDWLTKILSANLVVYNGKGQATEIYAMESPIPVNEADFTFSNNITTNNGLPVATNDSRYARKISFSYDNIIGTPLSSQAEGDVKNISLFGYDHSYVIAKVANADETSAFHTSFEEDDNLRGVWVTPQAYLNIKQQYVTTTFRTGERSYLLDGAPLQLLKTLPAGTYTLSLWATNEPSITSAVLKSTMQVSGSEWSYYEYEVVSGSVIKISGQVAGSKIDELRLYPQQALMETYTYKPLEGISSKTDIRNITTYYEYDALQRLHIVRDDEHNIRKRISYHTKLLNDLTLTASTASPKLNELITFSANINSNIDPSGYTFTWDFGDYTILSNTNTNTVTHSYKLCGTFQVSLIVEGHGIRLKKTLSLPVGNCNFKGGAISLILNNNRQVQFKLTGTGDNDPSLNPSGTIYTWKIFTDYNPQGYTLNALTDNSISKLYTLPQLGNITSITLTLTNPNKGYSARLFSYASPIRIDGNLLVSFGASASTTIARQITYTITCNDVTNPSSPNAPLTYAIDFGDGAGYITLTSGRGTDSPITGDLSNYSKTFTYGSAGTRCLKIKVTNGDYTYATSDVSKPCVILYSPKLTLGDISISSVKDRSTCNDSYAGTRTITVSNPVTDGTVTYHWQVVNAANNAVVLTNQTGVSFTYDFNKDATLQIKLWATSTNSNYEDSDVKLSASFVVHSFTASDEFEIIGSYTPCSGEVLIYERTANYVSNYTGWIYSETENVNTVCTFHYPPEITGPTNGHIFDRVVNGKDLCGNNAVQIIPCTTDRFRGKQKPCN